MSNQGFSSSQIDAELLLAHALQKDRGYLKAHPETPLNPDTESTANTLLHRRLQNEPIAFLTGIKEFYGINLKTDRRALIPRGESEGIVEETLGWLNHRSDRQVIAEIGTGSGAIILAVAHNAPQHTFIATDISQEALDLAQENAKTLGFTVCHSDPNGAADSVEESLKDPSTSLRMTNSIRFLNGNLGLPLLVLADYKGKINVLIANLPYIASGLLVTLDPTITYYEPNIALDGGEDGLELYRQFLPQAKELLAPGGIMFFEHEHDQDAEMRSLVAQYFPTAIIKTHQDYSGLNRFLSCQLP